MSYFTVHILTSSPNLLPSLPPSIPIFLLFFLTFCLVSLSFFCYYIKSRQDPRCASFAGDEVHAAAEPRPAQRSPRAPPQPLGGHTRYGDPWRPLGLHAPPGLRAGAEAGDQTLAG
jgi:hypothetical protein